MNDSTLYRLVRKTFLIWRDLPRGFGVDTISQYLHLNTSEDSLCYLTKSSQYSAYDEYYSIASIS